MIPNISFGSSKIVSSPLLVISSIAKAHMNFNLNITVLCVVLSSTLIIASPDILSMNGASTFVNFCSLGFSTKHSFGKIGRDLFKKLKQQSHEFITPITQKYFWYPELSPHFHGFQIQRYISQICVHVYLIL